MEPNELSWTKLTNTERREVLDSLKALAMGEYSDDEGESLLPDRRPIDSAIEALQAIVETPTV